MASPEDRMSTVVQESAYLVPDNYNRLLIEDWEAGPIALGDVTEGLYYQPWHLTWDVTTGNLIVTPSVIGLPVIVLPAVASVTQCSLAFDKTGHINIAYTANDLPYLYWYNTLTAGWVTTALPITVLCPTLTLDDKRSKESSNNDTILWWTEWDGVSAYTLYRALQRDRFDPLVPKLMKASMPKNIIKCGMNSGLRVQLSLTTADL